MRLTVGAAHVRTSEMRYNRDGGSDAGLCGFFGGTCVNTGCTPTKTLVASAYAAYLARRARRLVQNDAFRKAVLDGKPPAMPAWRDRLGDDDLKLLWAYVRSGG